MDFIEKEEEEAKILLTFIGILYEKDEALKYFINELMEQEHKFI